MHDNNKNIRSQRDNRVDRRTLLMIGAGAVAQAPLAATAVAEVSGPEESASDPRRLKFIETEHVRTFYDRSRF